MTWSPTSSRLRSCLFLIACSLGGCVEREPLDTAGESTSSSTTGGPGGSSGTTDAPTTGELTATTGDELTAGTTGVVSTGSTTGEVSTGTTSGDPTATSGTTFDPIGPEASGQFLLAVSTVIAPDLPLQFLATTTVTIEEGEPTLWLELQPLALGQAQVTEPRTPVGEPMILPGVPVIDNVFEIDLGTTAVTGQANPITGGDITASLLMRGTFFNADFYCGDIDGEVTVPLNAPLTGSTFAAVRVADPMALPLDVTINCAGVTVTDP